MSSAESCSMSFPVGLCESVFAKLSNTGSPILPLFGPSPGHCVCFVACGQLLCGVDGGRAPDQTSSIKGPERGGAKSPSTPGTYAERPLAGRSIMYTV